MSYIIILQWTLVLFSSILLFVLAPKVSSLGGFFGGASKKNKQPGIILLTTSLTMSWIMAKSVTNTANLGAQFGWLGGVTYAVYYLSFIVAGIVIYQLRTKGHFESIHQFLNTKFGRIATMLFTITIGFRLFNEVWSNTMVIGSYFGDYGSSGFIAAVVVFTILTLAYALKGGLRSSLITDAIQMGLYAILLGIILSLLYSPDFSVETVSQSSTLSFATGLDLFFVALLQIFSYPFHDPVLTDRGFISDPKTTLKGYFLASLLGFVSISAFGIIGVYGGSIGISEEAALNVAKSFGAILMLLMNFIMITSAASTLDSTFTSVAKLVVVDLNEKGNITLTRGRIVMVVIAVAGSLPLFFSPAVLSATTVSGTMVLGLAPIFLLWNVKAPKVSFYLSYGFGVLAGLFLLFGWIPEWAYVVNGHHAELLTANVYGSIVSFSGYLLPAGLLAFYEQYTEPIKAKLPPLANVLVVKLLDNEG